MTVLLQNRTISMILMVPDVDVSDSSSSSIIEKLDRSDIDSNSSIPVYHGSIIHIEQHNNDENTSDLIIRVPNFQHLSFLSNNIDNTQPQPPRIKRRAPICPILNNSNLSNINTTHNINNLNQNQSQLTNTNRLTTGLRSLSRAFTHGCKTKRSSSINEIKYPSILPDIEVMTEKFEISKSLKKNSKYQNSTSTMPKLITPKILFIKRKKFKSKKNQSSSSFISMNTQTKFNNNQTNSTPTSNIQTTHCSEMKEIIPCFQQHIEYDDFNQQTNIIENNDNKEQQNESIRLTYEVEQQFTAISQLISDIPISSTDGQSLSTHRYSTISGIVPDIQISLPDNPTEDILSTKDSYDFKNKVSPKINRPFRVQTSILQPDISVIRIGTNDLTTPIDHLLPGENFSNKQKQINDNYIEDNCYDNIHSNDETFTECYQITYQIDPKYKNEKEQITSKIDQSSISHHINSNLFEYKILPPYTTQNDNNLDYFQTISKEQDISTNTIKLNKSCSVDNLSQTNQSESISSECSSRHCILQRSNSYNGLGIRVRTDKKTCHEHFIHQVEQLSPGDQAGLKENDRILCINGTSVINEDYTVVLQLIKNGLQSDTLDFHVITNDDYEKFKSQIDQSYQ